MNRDHRTVPGLIAQLKAAKHIERGGGICGTCARAAEATPGNEGYSDCCRDRIEYDAEARQTLTAELAERDDARLVNIFHSWSTDAVKHQEVFLYETTDYRGAPAIVSLWNGFEQLHRRSDEGRTWSFA